MKNILIVEDERYLITALTDNLISEGYEVDFASNGDEAVEKLALKKPDLILLDILMPKKNGFYVLEKLKDRDALKNIPVIVLSNLGEYGPLKQAMALGARDFLVKSECQIEDVIEKVNKYLT